MVYLSKISLEQTSQAARELVHLSSNGAYSAHQLLWKLFSDERERPFLFREEMQPCGRPLFFVLSEVRPQVIERLFSIQTKVFEPKLSAGQRLAYKLRVNPTVCMTAENGKSKRHDVMMHAKYRAKREGEDNPKKIQWMMEQAAHEWIANAKRLEQWGISLDALPDIERYTQHRSKKRRGHSIEFSSVDFQGVLTVQDAERYFSQYCKGFGRAKGLGCGLMLIRAV